MECVT